MSFFTTAVLGVRDRNPEPSVALAERAEERHGLPRPIHQDGRVTFLFPGRRDPDRERAAALDALEAEDERLTGCWSRPPAGRRTAERSIEGQALGSPGTGGRVYAITPLSTPVVTEGRRHAVNAR